MGRYEKVELTTMCMVYRGDTLLLQNRTKPDWPGWTFPGGHVEACESFVQAVKREVLEETGLTIENRACAGLSSGKRSPMCATLFCFLKRIAFPARLPLRRRARCGG